MGKKEQQANNQANKSHKTLRDKLRKKRQQLKKHKKQKSEKHKNYDPNQKKKNFFEQTNAKKKKRQDGIKQHKLNKYIEKFVDIYEDDVEDFYELFETLDQGGKIDITDVADPAMQKCLKKLFKYLPLNKKKLQYQKKQGVSTKLHSLMKELVSKSIQNYMQNGTDQEKPQQNELSDKQSSNQNMKNQNQKQKKKSKKKSKKQNIQQKQVDKEEQKKKKMEIQNQNIRQYERLVLYPQKGQAIQKNQDVVGPCISAQQRQFLAKMFEQQSKKNQQVPQQTLNINENQDNDQFAKIFSMTSNSKRTQNQNNKSQPRANIDDIPQELLAEGSAKIGQKQQIDANQIQQYDKIHRPRKLIQEYQQMKKLGKYAENGQDGNKKRTPFDRERDIVNGRSRQFMNNGVFFDFKERMSKPKSNNNFL